MAQLLDTPLLRQVLKIILISTIDILLNHCPSYMGIKKHTRELILRFHLYLGIKIHTQVVENAVYFNFVRGGY